MRAIFDGIEIEGTPAEVAEFVRSMKIDPDSSNADAKVVHSQIPEAEASNITENFAYRVLKRRPLSSNQRQLLAALKEANDDWTLASEITRRFDWDGTQLGGVLGGLGRRMTATNGYKEGYALWNWRWDDDEGTWAYRLPKVVLAALDRLSL